MTHSTRRILLIVSAAPVFLLLPVGVAMLAMTGKQLVFGFDDQPILAMISGFVLGVVIALASFAFVCSHALRGSFRVAMVLTLVAFVFDLAVVPVARLITKRVEHPELFLNQRPSHEPNKALVPTFGWRCRSLAIRSLIPPPSVGAV
jgi:hypothetical protein